MSDDIVDPKAVPGTFEKIDGAWVRTDEATIGASVPGATLSLEAAMELAEANVESGFPVPPQAQAVIDAAAAADAADRSKAKGRRGGAPEPTTGGNAEVAPVATQTQE